MFIPKFNKNASKNGTKLAKIVRLDDVEPDFESLIQDFDVFDPDTNNLHGRFEVKTLQADICECKGSKANGRDALSGRALN